MRALRVLRLGVVLGLVAVSGCDLLPPVVRAARCAAVPDWPAIDVSTPLGMNRARIPWHSVPPPGGPAGLVSAWATADGMVHLGFDQVPGDDAEVFRQSFPRPDFVVVERVRHSPAELKAIAAEIWWNGLTSWVDAKWVTVQLPPGNEIGAGWLRGAYGDAVSITVGAKLFEGGPEGEAAGCLAVEPVYVDGAAELPGITGRIIGVKVPATPGQPVTATVEIRNRRSTAADFKLKTGVTDGFVHTLIAYTNEIVVGSLTRPGSPNAVNIGPAALWDCAPQSCLSDLGRAGTASLADDPRILLGVPDSLLNFGGAVNLASYGRSGRLLPGQSRRIELVTDTADATPGPQSVLAPGSYDLHAQVLVDGELLRITRRISLK